MGEDIAADYLEKNGYRIVRRTQRFGKNELDIVCEDDDFIVFVEVKTRSCLYPESGDFGIPSRAVDEGKRKNTVKASRDYPQYGIAKHKGYGTKAHMDALREFGPSPIHRKKFIRFLDEN